MENINEVIGNNIRDLRKLNKLTQYDLAEKLNYSNKTISRWEAGEIIPDVQTLNKICELFKIPLSQIFEPDIINKKKMPQWYKFQLGNKLTITLLFIAVVWLIATILFVHIKINYNFAFWQAFIWAIPFSAIVGWFFNNRWGKKKLNYIFYSIINWTTITSLYLTIYNYTFWMLFIIGIPIQICILLWANISHNNRSDTKK